MVLTRDTGQLQVDASAAAVGGAVDGGWDSIFYPACSGTARLGAVQEVAVVATR